MKNLVSAPTSHDYRETEPSNGVQGTNEQVMKEGNAHEASAPIDIPTALDANEQANAGSRPANTAPKITSIIPIGIDSSRIYTIGWLKKNGYKQGRLRINRGINARDVKKKMKSIKRSLGIISPIMMVAARACLEQGLDVEAENGKLLSLDDPDIDMYIVTIDGQHREEAVACLNRELKPEETPYSIPVIFPQVTNANIITMLGESNIATRPWKGIDHLTPLLNGRNIPGVNADVNETLEIVYLYANNDGCSEIAAWSYATGTYKRQPTATRLYNAQTDVKTRNDLIAGSNKFGRSIYKALQEAKIEQKIIGSKEVSRWFIEKLHEIVSDGKKTLEEATEIIKGFIESLTESMVTAINQSGGRTEEVNGAQHKFSRYHVACETFNSFFGDYLKTEE